MARSNTISPCLGKLGKIQNSYKPNHVSTPYIEPTGGARVYGRQGVRFGFVD
jgi:hypothetical protein